MVEETLKTIKSDDDGDGVRRAKQAKRDRLTFRQSQSLGMQMLTSRQTRSKQAEKVIGFEALQKVSGAKEVSSQALVSRLAQKPANEMIESPSQGTFKYELVS